MDLTFRRATNEDYDVILALDPEHEIYEGEDYFPSQLQRYFKDPNKTVLLCAHEGRVVSMETRTRHNFINLLTEHISGVCTCIGLTGCSVFEGRRIGGSVG